MSINTSFGSDNHWGVHPRAMEAVTEANRGPVTAYGADPWTEAAVQVFRRHFGAECAVFFLFTGTGANVTAIKAMTQPHQAVICPTSAHINSDECGAPEHFTGCKLLAVPCADGKLTPALAARFLRGRLDQHHVQPRVISISQATELGTVYRPEEVRALADFAHENGLLLHMDGARLANAAAGLGCGLCEISGAAGVDMLSFGGSKNGLMAAEALVCFRPELAADVPFIRKQAMQLPSKMRFVAAQFLALLEGDLWRENAAHANRLARRLAALVDGAPGLEIVQPVEANALFVRLPRAARARIGETHFFYDWDEEAGIVRWMTSFAMVDEEVEAFAATVRQALDVAR